MSGEDASNDAVRAEAESEVDLIAAPEETAIAAQEAFLPRTGSTIALVASFAVLSLGAVAAISSSRRKGRAHRFR